MAEELPCGGFPVQILHEVLLRATWIGCEYPYYYGLPNGLYKKKFNEIVPLNFNTL